jgi:hypothetical protein
MLSQNCFAFFPVDCSASVNMFGGTLYRLGKSIFSAAFSSNALGFPANFLLASPKNLPDWWIISSLVSRSVFLHGMN